MTTTKLLAHPLPYLLWAKAAMKTARGAQTNDDR